MHTGDTERTGSTYTEEYGSAVHRSAYDEVYGFAENAVYSSGYNEVLVHGSAYTEAAPRYAYEGAYGSTVYQGGPATWRAFEEPVHTGFPTWPVAPTRRPLSIETATHKQSTAWMKKARSSTAHDGGRATWKGSKAEATQTYFKINEQIVQA